MNKVAIKKRKTLRTQLLDIEISKPFFIPFREYTEMHVRKIVRILNQKGYSYEASTRDVINGINVIRLK